MGFKDAFHPREKELDLSLVSLGPLVSFIGVLVSSIGSLISLGADMFQEIILTMLKSETDMKDNLLQVRNE